jgi:Tfp pilus assembly protein PilO|tara:strand:+ start:3075 stop:3695 length:621 start_codon:yes stop_codon:yes gene_type:complete
MDLNNFQFRNFIKSLEGVFDKDNLKKLSIYFFSSTSLIIVFYILFYLIFAPTERDYLSMEENKNNVIKTESSIENIIVAIKKLKPVYEKQSALFHNKNEVEELYRSLSISAVKNNLVITTLAKDSIMPIFEEKDLKKDKVYYYKIPITYEITGDFLSYIKFKKFISSSNKLINIEKEIISLNKNDTNGKIIAQGQLSVAGLPYELF